MNREWYEFENEKILGSLKTSYQGLSDAEVLRRRNEYGPNTLKEISKVTIFTIFFSQFKSSLIYILIVAGIIAFFLGETIDGSIIFAIILLNAVIGTVQEGKARNTLEALEKVVTSRATVIRNGDQIVIPDKDIVPGDILSLKDGDTIPADARIISVNSLKINEASLTGESEPVHKISEAIKADKVPIADQHNMVFRGTYVISGLAQAVVVRTGNFSAIGKIADQLDDLNTDVPLKKNIKNFSKAVIVVVGVISIILFTAGILRGIEVVDIFFVVVAVAVSAIPESLPVVVTLVLVTGVWRMSKKNALVKRLQAVEALGQANVIALDKTGTITKNQMMVEKLYVNDSFYEVKGDGYEPKGDVYLDGERINPGTHEEVILAGKVAVFTSIASTAYDEEKNEWTEAALLVFGKKIGLEKFELEKQYPKTLEIPFDLSNKYHTTINTVDDKSFLSTVGSPEAVLKKVTTVWENGKVHQLTKDKLDRIQEAILKFSEGGYRVLALAGSFNPPKRMYKNSLPPLTFIGLVGIIDVIRPEVYDAVKIAQEADMNVVMITGDHKRTAHAIAQKIGICSKEDTVLSGSDIENMSDGALLQMVATTKVYARVSPEHKLRIIKAYKDRGDIIAMTGDGINDALSLAAADLGVSMGKTGTEVAREASDIVLLDDNFGNIIAAAEEGRNIYRIIRRAILYLVSTNLGEMMVIVIAVIVGWPLPLLATQILWLNMVTDTFLVAALAVDPKTPNLMKEKFVKPSKWLVDKTLGLRSLLIATVMTVGTLSLFIMFLPQGMVKAWTVSLTMLTVFQWYNVFNVRSKDSSVLKQNILNNPYLIMGLVLAVVLHMIAIYTPFMQKVLHLTSLNASEWLLILIVGLSVILVEEIRKFVARIMRRSKELKLSSLDQSLS